MSTPNEESAACAQICQGHELATQRALLSNYTAFAKKGYIIY